MSYSSVQLPQQVTVAVLLPEARREAYSLTVEKPYSRGTLSHINMPPAVDAADVIGFMAEGGDTDYSGDGTPFVDFVTP